VSLKKTFGGAVGKKRPKGSSLSGIVFLLSCSRPGCWAWGVCQRRKKGAFKKWDHERGGTSGVKRGQGTPLKLSKRVGVERNQKRNRINRRHVCLQKEQVLFTFKGKLEATKQKGEQRSRRAHNAFDNLRRMEPLGLTVRKGPLKTEG